MDSDTPKTDFHTIRFYHQQVFFLHSSGWKREGRGLFLIGKIIKGGSHWVYKSYGFDIIPTKSLFSLWSRRRRTISFQPMSFFIFWLAPVMRLFCPSRLSFFSFFQFFGFSMSKNFSTQKLSGGVGKRLGHHDDRRRHSRRCFLSLLRGRHVCCR